MIGASHDTCASFVTRSVRLLAYGARLTRYGGGVLIEHASR